MRKLFKEFKETAHVIKVIMFQKDLKASRNDLEKQNQKDE
jgi:hypothetical protein